MPKDVIKIKVSYPTKWDRDYGQPMYLKQTPGNKGEWGNCKFYINDPTCTECDFWFIYENIDAYLMEEGSCAFENCIFITGEERTMWSYDQKFIDQFGGVITSRDDIQHPNVIKMHYVSPWHVKKSYDSLTANTTIEKTKNLSAIISDAVSLPGHKLRYAFTNRMQGHFKQRLDWYGKGAHFIDDKWDGLAPYLFSIAIENAPHAGYFTEKILDCFLSLTVPFYFGCTDIDNYFPAEAIIKINPADYLGAIEIIEAAMHPDNYNKLLPYLHEAKDLTLNKYQFFPSMVEFVNNYQKAGTQKHKIVIREKRLFEEHRLTMKQMLVYQKKIIQYKLKNYKV